MTRFAILGTCLIGLSACGRTALMDPTCHQCPGDACPASCAALAFDTTELVTKTDTVALTGRCAAGFEIAATGANAPTYPCNSGRFTVDVSATTDGYHPVHLTQPNAGSGSSADARWIRDTTGPVLSEAAAADGSASSSRRYVPLTVHAVDALSAVTALCVKVDDSAAPSISDPCWATLAGTLATQPGLDVRVDDLTTELGFLSATYISRIWARDAATNISVLVGDGSEGSDRVSIAYQPTPPPTVLDVIAANNDAPSAPLAPSDLTVAQGGDVVVKWRAVDDEPLPQTPIAVYVTTDNRTYSLVARDLANAANGPCVVNVPSTTIDDRATGCFVWSGGAPANTYFSMRVIAVDNEGYTTAASAPPLNTAPLEVIAGNFDSGIDASASSAMFFAYVDSGSIGGSQSTVMTRDGHLYFRDRVRGLVVVDPRDGVQRVLIPQTGVSTDGPLATATLKEALRLTIDANERLYIYDSDRIRRVDLKASPQTITTIIGGGSSAADGVPGTDVAIWPGGAPLFQMSNLVVLPNGDVLFESDHYDDSTSSGARIRILDHTTGLVRSIAVSGVGDMYDAGANLAACRFEGFFVAYDRVTSAIEALVVLLGHGPELVGCGGDVKFSRIRIDPTTGEKLGELPELGGWDADALAVTALDGEIYTIRRIEGISRLDRASGTWTLLAGQAGPGDCADGTPIATCHMDLTDAFVDHNGRLIFQSRGRIRTVDSGGSVRTLAGQSTSFGDGGLPTSARFGRIDVVQPRAGGYLVLDIGNGTFRQIKPGLSVNRLAGNGNLGYPVGAFPAVEEPLAYNGYGRLWSTFAVDANDIVYYSRGGAFVAKLDEGGEWVNVAGNESSAVRYSDAAAEGLNGTSINLELAGFEMHPPRVLGVGASDLLVARYALRLPERSPFDSFVLRYGLADGLQHVVAGVAGASTGGPWCPSETALSACVVPQVDSGDVPQAVYDDSVDGWIVSKTGENLLTVLADAGAASRLVQLSRGAVSYAVHNVGGHRLYYCSIDGNVRLHDFATGSDTALPWTIPEARCSGLGMVVDAAGDVVVPYRIGDMFGVLRIRAGAP